MPPKKTAAATERGSNGTGPSSSAVVAPKPRTKVTTARGYKRPDRLPDGYLIEDGLNKRSWRVGPLLGQGGFADVYLVSDHVTKPVTSATAKNVLKFEPADNGPLFQEIHFFKAAAKKDLILAFMTKHNLKSLGIMEYIASGVIELNDKRFRWLVIPRLGRVVQDILEESGGVFSRPCVILLALQLLDILEYVHSNGYAHADLKAANLMTGMAKTDGSQIYLIDFGLVKRFMTDGEHIAYVENPKAAHDGTLELTSVDSHKGAAPSRRGDLQILGFNLIKWLLGSLPWSEENADANFVRSQKITYFQNLSEFFRVTFPQGSLPPKEIVEYFQAIKNLKYVEEPDYKNLRAIFQKASKEAKVRRSDLFAFPAQEPTASTSRASASQISLPSKASPKKRGRKAANGDPEDVTEVGGDEVAQKRGMKSKMSSSSTSGSSTLEDIPSIDLAKLPPGQRRKVKAVMEAAAGSDNLRGTDPLVAKPAARLANKTRGVATSADKGDAEVIAALAKLPPGQRRKAKEAMKAAEEHEDIHPSTSGQTQLSTRTRPVRGAAGGKSYATVDSDTDNDAVTVRSKGGKRSKKDEL